MELSLADCIPSEPHQNTINAQTLKQINYDIEIHRGKAFTDYECKNIISYYVVIFYNKILSKAILSRFQNAFGLNEISRELYITQDPRRSSIPGNWSYSSVLMALVNQIGFLFIQYFFRCE